MILSRFFICFVCIMTDLEIIEKCINWDLKKFSILYDKYIDKIYRFVYLKINDKETAEDIVSEVFVSALNKIDTFKINENSSVSAWIYKIAYNKTIDFYKSNKNYDDIDNCLELALNTDFAKDVDNKDKLKEIFKYIKTLKKEHQEVFMYRIWEDLSYKEISEITWLSIDNCKKIVSRTIKNIVSQFWVLALILLIV